METLADGVEDEEQLAILRRGECRSIQSYLLSFPMTADQVKSWTGAWPLSQNRFSESNMAEREGFNR